jgi:MEMO1 family protein
MDTEIRKPSVAGLFYPADKETLSTLIKNTLNKPSDNSFVKALIVPHAAYKYIGEMLAQAYAHLLCNQEQIKTVILLGASHHVKFNGIAITSKSYYATPLGEVSINTDVMIRLLNFPQIIMFDETHIREHSLELQLPFLQSVLSEFKIIPLLVGETNSHSIVEILNKLWGCNETLIIASLNLSFQQSYAAAQKSDQIVAQAIETLQWQSLQPHHTCNSHLLTSLLKVVHQKSLTPHVLQMCNSGDITGKREQVVGYGTFIFK